MLLNEGDIVFKFLITHKGIVLSAKLSMCTPLLARVALVALPAKFNALSLYRTRDKRTTRTHAVFAFASATPAFTLCVIVGAKPARQATNTNFGMFDLHGYTFERGGGIIATDQAQARW